MKTNRKKLLDWIIDCVGGPGETYDKYGRVRGYKVVVKYTHHGSDELFFGEEAAKQTVKFYQNRIAKQRKVQLTRQK